MRQASGLTTTSSACYSETVNTRTDRFLDYDWEIISAIVSGGSAIDLGRLTYRTEQAARAFLAAYGFDPREEEGQREMRKIVPLALAFIEEELLPVGPLERIPPDLSHDPVELLTYASQPEHPLRDWACSLLRVCHAVAHGMYLPGRDRVSEACAIFEGRLRPHLRHSRGKLYLGDIPIVRSEFKTEKPWNSLLLKMLYKKDSVAEEIYDQVGLRIVTYSRADTLLVIRYLVDRNVVVYPNIKPSRSHNTLIDLAEFRRFLDGARKGLEDGRLDGAGFEAEIEAYQREVDVRAGAVRNPYTDEHYRSIQFTTRVMITRKTDAGDVERFFFPFEIQVMDEQAYRRNIVGKSNHQAYRERQRDAARHRVFPWLREKLEAGELAEEAPAMDEAPAQPEAIG